DLRTFSPEPWRGCVDLVTAGYPCQGESNAGKRRGSKDPRWLWNDVWRVVCGVGARLLFVENVAAHVNRSFPQVLATLAESGWAAEWDCVPAAAVGAPHQRDRVFCLAAHPDLYGPQGKWRGGLLNSERETRRVHADRHTGSGPATDTECPQLRKQSGRS